MKNKLLLFLALFLLSFSKEIKAWELQLGANLGGEYLNFSMFDYDSALKGAIEEAITSQSLDITVEPKEFTGENGFDYGGYVGIKLGFSYFGVRITHADLYMKAKDDPETQYNESNIGFDMGLTVIQGVYKFVLPLWIFQPFAGIAIGYVYLDTTAEVPGATSNEKGKGSTTSNGFDGSCMLGLDINIGKWFAIGAMANFSFIFFTNEDGSSWGFATEYLLRLTLRI